jgi:predicted nucleic acid-binding protein
VASDRGLVLRSIALARRFRIALWDALIVTAAQDGGCSLVLSEDLQHGRSFDNVSIQNPFPEGDGVNERV